MSERDATHYKVLGVPETASAEEIERAYRARIGATHPDRARDEADRLRRTRAAAAVNEAGRVLRDPDRRAVYDYDLAAARRVELAARIIVAHPVTRPDTTRYPYPAPPPPSPWTSPQPEFHAEPAEAEESWTGVPRHLRGSWRDLWSRARSQGWRPALVAFARWNRLGQWLVLAAIVAIAIRAEIVFWPEVGMDWRPIAAVAAAWLVVGAVWSRSWADHPLGQLLRVVGGALEGLFGALGDDQAR